MDPSSVAYQDTKTVLNDLDELIAEVVDDPNAAKRIGKIPSILLANFRTNRVKASAPSLLGFGPQLEERARAYAKRRTSAALQSFLNKAAEFKEEALNLGLTRKAAVGARRHRRKTRRNRKGGAIQVGLKTSRGTVLVSDIRTPRDLLREAFPDASEDQTFRMFENKREVTDFALDTPFPFKSYNTATYEFVRVLATPTAPKRGVSRVVLDRFFKTLPAAKVVLFSGAAEDNVKKNVNQQFKFFRQPTTPIVLIDEVFNRGYDFFHYVKFEAKDMGPYIRRYTKPRGEPFAPSTDPLRTAAEKEAYLAEVNQMARDNRVNPLDELVIYTVIADLTNETFKDTDTLKFYDFGA